MRAAVLLFSLFSALPAVGADRYRVVFSGQSQLPLMPPALKVVVDGANWRIDVEKASEPLAFDSLISSDGGHTWIALNSENQTWYRFDSPAPLIPRSRLLLGSSHDSLDQIRWSLAEEPADEDRPATRKYVGKLSYRVHRDVAGTSLTITCSAIVLIWTTDGIDRRLWPATSPLSIGHAAVDAEIGKSAKDIIGFPFKITMAATRRYEGGIPVTDTITMTASEPRAVDIAGSQFQRPPDYREQRPIIGAPGH